jgi:secretion/DNA translocation related TadE-like protein
VTRETSEQGSATLWVLCAIAVVIAVGSAGIAAGVVTLARHRAAIAADAAALAAAGDVLAGPAGACAAAASIARTDGARLVRCGLDGAGAQVEVTVALPGVLRRFGAADGSARAGP